MNRRSKEAADPTNRPQASDAGEIARVPNTSTFPRDLPGWLHWAGGGVAVAICIAILLMWGIYGPTYLFDLIAAYCA
jgi:hypothetical protein